VRFPRLFNLGMWCYPGGAAGAGPARVLGSMKIVYTRTDEAPALATQSLLPIVRAFAAAAGVEIEERDLSLAGRILAQFPDRLEEDQRVADALNELGDLAKTPEANIVKLPNISASVPQLKAAIEELQGQGFAIPDYPEDPADDEQREIRARYDKVKGSAVNPVLRQGNSDRRAPASVKEFARHHPHPMGEWSSDSRAHVATMSDGDFRSTERSLTVEREASVRIEHVAPDGTITVLRERVPVLAGEVLDGAVMHRSALQEFLREQLADAKEHDILFSVHLKTTMMRVSDPIIFGHALRAYFADVFEQHGDALARAGVNPNDGLAALLKAIEQLPDEERDAIESSIEAAYETGPRLAMVDSGRGITNLHVPSDVIIDASMPAAIRASGRMWNAQGEQEDAKFVIPDHSYAAVYAETVDHCREHGAFDPATMGSTPNIGLMAQSAEEYGSHDKTFEIAETGSVRVVRTDDNETLLEHEVSTGDIWRMCQTKDAPIQDWVRLAVSRARETGTPAVFWLDEDRPHDGELLRKVRAALDELDTDGAEIEILGVVDAARYTLERARRGEDTISVTGNVLRDYLTDLFPILELGTSAKMLSIVPLMNGGGLFETGAGGSAPRHVQQFLEENHLRWDSLGEFLALTPSLELLAEKENNPKARVLGATLDRATGRVLERDHSPSRQVGELDNRGSHFYLALYWAQELAEQSDDPELAERFTELAQRLSEHEDEIVDELTSVQGSPVEIGGYYHPDTDEAIKAMRPSETLNEALDSLGTLSRSAQEDTGG
jgi:isocitrate dehydrogenase